jgi:hypothetical protein
MARFPAARKQYQNWVTGLLPDVQPPLLAVPPFMQKVLAVPPFSQLPVAMLPIGEQMAP